MGTRLDWKKQLKVTVLVILENLNPGSFVDNLQASHLGYQPSRMFTGLPMPAMKLLDFGVGSRFHCLENMKV